MIPNKRKPVALVATGSHKIDTLEGKIDKQNNTPDALHLQASRIRARFPGLSWPVARVTAELAFGGAA